jgi:hypothetical protein
MSGTDRTGDRSKQGNRAAVKAKVTPHPSGIKPLCFIYCCLLGKNGPIKDKPSVHVLLSDVPENPQLSPSGKLKMSLFLILLFHRQFENLRMQYLVFKPHLFL